MLISKTVLVRWNSNTMRYYISKGYNFTKTGEFFEVKVEDLMRGSNTEVNVQCDYCKEMFKQRYSAYVISMESYIPKNACDNCKNIKLKEVRRIQNKSDKPIIIKNNVNIGITEEKLISDISNMIIKYGRFPKQSEIYNELHITQKVIKAFGGMINLRKLLNYKNDTELVDDRGYLNSSTYEYMVAQFLIQYNIPYRREENPFLKVEGYHRSDFAFYTTNDEEIHCEVWGYDTTRTNSKINNRYKKHREEKERLYNKYSIPLISIYCKIFNNTYDNIQKELYHIFKPYLNIEFKEVNSDYLIPPSKISDQELFDRVMSLSSDGLTLPIPSDLRYNNSGLLYQVNKRFGNWWSFAEHFGKETNALKYNYWTDERLYDAFVYVLNKYNKVLNGDKLRVYSKDNTSLKGYYDAIKRNGTYIDYVLKFADKYVKSNMPFNDGLNKYLLKIKNKGNKNITLIQQKIAEEILENVI